MQRFLLLAGSLAILSLYALTLATKNASGLGDYFWWIIAGSATLTILLFILLLHYAWRLLQDSRNGVFGSQIARRLATMFTLVAVLPGLFLFGVSAQFISSSINSWFGNDTQEALERSLNLSKSALELTLDNSIRKAATVQVALISTLSLENDPNPILKANRNQFNQLAVYNLSDGHIIASINPQSLPTPKITSSQTATLANNGSIRNIENINNTLYAQGWLALTENNKQHYALFFRQTIPQNVADDATLIEAARAKYAELSYAKQGLQTFFLITLLMATLLAIMLALVWALYFARRFVEPILSLAQGARAVAQGDFSQKPPIYRNDELGRLTHLFNHMTEQLAIAQAAAENNRLQQEAARHYLECVLSSLSSGVITLDETGRLKTFNRSAENILSISLTHLLGTPWTEWHQQSSPEYANLAETFAIITDTTSTNKPVQITYTTPDESRILLTKATPLPSNNDTGLVIVFDDITALVRAQKDAAWGEVAKRLAHEIRNPLTPIQLSAERLAWKLQDKLNEQDTHILNRSTDTIIKQVAAMKEMVEAFRNYARAPSLKLGKLDLNQIIDEVLLLYEGSSCTFTAKFSNIALWVAADTGAMRQVLHNILKNAAEAAEDDPTPQVVIETRQENGYAILTVCNNGKAFSKDMLHHAFDPYVTDKPTGTGLGLPVVKKLIEEHGGKVSLSNPTSGGACVKIVLPELVEENYA